ncbi:Crp/Fnr family transcriptional regulator [Aureibacter tunicatorum]|uniref:CRP-like cAMP-binding protein n=1 Tax=Aureibacter tunicatorum TaxID=866807 RepID=A0AAE4BUS4_9BACT|nr:cyclic nucleotide-binding domain-containing protein [Aureibacter tunicatorum]MDR6241107.1 CRP-like cAMP-binding protein [Aureibacter tunicatorum]BDD03885.1 Crp/Fnr family transcriptional regulator [Aureibacter tunicatorum]
MDELNQIKRVLDSMIRISENEMTDFLKYCFIKQFKKKEFLSASHSMVDEIFFIKQGLIRFFLIDQNGTEHTTYFAMENQFICDYSSFIRKAPSIYSLEALENTEVVVLPRESIEWAYNNMAEGNKMGRLISEFYFIQQDNQIRDQYIRTPKELYDSITTVFPDIHNRVPQHMIASYLGITSVHLSRLKKAEYSKS